MPKNLSWIQISIGSSKTAVLSRINANACVVRYTFIVVTIFDAQTRHVQDQLHVEFVRRNDFQTFILGDVHGCQPEGVTGKRTFIVPSHQRIFLFYHTNGQNFFEASTDLMKVVARACGHSDLNNFSLEDLTTFDRDMHHLTGIPYAGVNP